MMMGIFKRKCCKPDKDCESPATRRNKDNEVSKVVVELDKVLSHAYEHDMEEMVMPVELVTTCRNILAKYE